MYCRLEQGNFNNPDMIDSYLLKDGESVEQGEALNDGWLVCCAKLFSDGKSENRVYYSGEYIRIVDITQMHVFSTDVDFTHPDFELINRYSYGFGSKHIADLKTYRNINYDPKNRKSAKLMYIQK